MMQSSFVQNPRNCSIPPECHVHFYIMLNEFDSDQLRSIVAACSSNSSMLNNLRNLTRAELFQKCFLLIDNCGSRELEEIFYSIRRKRFRSNLSVQQTQSNTQTAFNPQQSTHRNQSTTEKNGQSDYYLSLSTISQQLPTRK